MIEPTHRKSLHKYGPCLMGHSQGLAITSQMQAEQW